MRREGMREERFTRRLTRELAGRGALVGLAVLVGTASVLAQGAPSEEEGSTLMNLLRYGSTTVPPAAPAPVDTAYCPSVDVAEGGAATSTGGREGSLRSQIALGQIARECAAQPDGSVVVKVGIVGRALLGPGGAPGHFESPLFIAIKRNGATVASRAKRVSVTIPSGEAQATFTVLEDGLVVPAAAARDYEIEVGLGGGPKAARAPRRKARTAAQPG